MGTNYNTARYVGKAAVVVTVAAALSLIAIIKKVTADDEKIHDQPVPMNIPPLVVAQYSPHDRIEYSDTVLEPIDINESPRAYVERTFPVQERTIDELDKYILGQVRLATRQEPPVPEMPDTEQPYDEGNQQPLQPIEPPYGHQQPSLPSMPGTTGQTDNPPTQGPGATVLPIHGQAGTPPMPGTERPCDNNTQHLDHVVNE